MPAPTAAIAKRTAWMLATADAPDVEHTKQPLGLEVVGFIEPACA